MCRVPEGCGRQPCLLQFTSQGGMSSHPEKKPTSADCVQRTRRIAKETRPAILLFDRCIPAASLTRFFFAGAQKSNRAAVLWMLVHEEGGQGNSEGTRLRMVRSLHAMQRQEICQVQGHIQQTNSVVALYLRSHTARPRKWVYFVFVTLSYVALFTYPHAYVPINIPSNTSSWQEEHRCLCAPSSACILSSLLPHSGCGWHLFCFILDE